MNVLRLGSVISGLHCFSVASRYLSFTKAAEELCLTPGAVSHRVRQLEDHLGFPLFHRFPRRLALTAEGQALFATTQRAFDLIETEIRSLENHAPRGNLVVASPPSFITNWLLPRLDDFAARYPDINLHLQGRTQLPSFETEHVDVAIHYGPREHPGLNVVFLAGEEITPVCSPGYAAAHDLYGRPEALRACRLLHDNAPWPSGLFYGEWKMWLEHAGHADIDCTGGYSFDRADLALNRAAAGFGVAMGRMMLVRRHLDEGSLCMPFREVLGVPQSYTFITTKEDAQSIRITCFLEWVREQLEGTAAGIEGNPAGRSGQT